jgi:sulfur relay protein TusB/DsrH
MLYLLGDKIIGPVGLQHAQMDDDAIIVLIKDGVYLDIQAVQGKKIYAIDEDVKRRGMGARLKDKAEVIGYDRLVDLVFEHKVANYV